MEGQGRSRDTHLSRLLARLLEQILSMLLCRLSSAVMACFRHSLSSSSSLRSSSCCREKPGWWVCVCVCVWWGGGVGEVRQSQHPRPGPGPRKAVRSKDQTASSVGLQLSPRPDQWVNILHASCRTLTLALDVALLMSETEEYGRLYFQ